MPTVNMGYKTIKSLSAYPCDGRMVLFPCYGRFFCGEEGQVPKLWIRKTMLFALGFTIDMSMLVV